MYTDKRLDKPLITTTPSIIGSPLNDVHVPHALSPSAQHTMLHGQHDLAQHPNIGHSHHLLHSTIQQQRQHIHAQHLTLTQHHHQQQQTTLTQQQQHLGTAQHPHPHHQQHQQQQQQQQPNISSQNQHQQQQQSAMFARFDANKSTKGASKLRRDLINAEISNLRDLLPLPQSTRQRLSQLQLMALVCVYVRKANYFQQVFKRREICGQHTPTPNIGFSKALSGFLMMLTQNGKLLYISDNAAEYLGHSMEDLLIHGDSVYDIIDKQDHAAIQAELNRNVPQQPGQHASSAAAAAAAMSSLEGEHRMFLCRMNVSRNARRQMRFGDQKVVLVQGHYLSFLPLCSRNEPVFLATCTPIAMPETRECVVQGATNVFTTIHSMDMKIAHIDKNGEFHLGYNKNEVQGVSWYNLIHSEHLREAQNKHRLITQSEQDRSCILLVRMQRQQGDYIWVHVVLQVRDSQDASSQPVVVCTNQVLNDREASVMIANSWLYHYYSVQSKIQFGLPFEGQARLPPPNSVFYHAHPHHTNPQHQLPSTLPATLPTNAGIASGYQTAMHPQYHHMSAYGSLYNFPANVAAHSHIVGHSHNNCHIADGSDNHVAIERYPDNSYLQPSYQERLSEGGGIQPVDYSQPVDGSSSASPTLASLKAVELRCGSANSSASSRNANTPNFNNSSKSNNIHLNETMHHLSSSPPAKKRAITIGKLEPLYLTSDSPEHGSQLTEMESHFQSHNQNHAHSTSMGMYSVESHGSVVFATVVPTRPRLLPKTLPRDPPDFIDQWNPSPPWSETAQKICIDNSCSQQELSPCITTTPPTPTSAPTPGCQALGPGPAFSFEWMSDQCVPIIDGTASTCASCMTSNGLPALTHPHHQSHTHSHSHSHHWTTTITPVHFTMAEEDRHRPQTHRLRRRQSTGTVNEPHVADDCQSSQTKTEIVENIDEKDSENS